MVSTAGQSSQSTMVGEHRSLSRSRDFRSARMQYFLRKLLPWSQALKLANSEMRKRCHVLSVPSTGFGATGGGNPELLSWVTKDEITMARHRDAEHPSKSFLRALSRPRRCPEHVLLCKMNLAPSNCCHVGLLECRVSISCLFKKYQRSCVIFFPMKFPDFYYTVGVK